MVRTHPSTPAQRAQWVSQLITHDGEYGVVTALSRRSGVSRQTLYTWKAQGLAALEHTWQDRTPPVVTPTLERQILTVLVEGHSSYSGIQTCLRQLTTQAVSLGTIAAVVAAAEQRAVTWMRTHAPPTSRTIALDELYGNNRRGAYLNVVDTQSYAVWAAEGPLAVDTESWTLVLWLAQDRGLRWHATSSDGGTAIQAACRVVDPQGQHGRDVWHVLHTCAQVQGRLDRQVAQLQDQTATVARQAARVAAGLPPKGRSPKTDVAAHLTEVRQAQWTAEALRFLTQELHALLEVVVLDHHGLVDAARRQGEIDTLLGLVAELRQAARPQARGELQRLHTHLTKAMPALLAFVAPLERVQQAFGACLEAAEVALVAWAWQRRAILGPQREQLLLGLPEAWRGAARVLMAAWDGAVRASSAVENWHSILRPHLAVHRTLSPGRLALLAVWRNHRVFTRGAHAGCSPLQLSGMADAPTDWLVALGYPPAADAASSPAGRSLPSRRALAA